VLEVTTKKPSEVQTREYLYWIERIFSQYPMAHMHGRFPRRYCGQHVEQLEQPKGRKKRNAPRPNDLVKDKEE